MPQNCNNLNGEYWLSWKLLYFDSWQEGGGCHNLSETNSSKGYNCCERCLGWGRTSMIQHFSNCTSYHRHSIPINLIMKAPHGQQKKGCFRCCKLCFQTYNEVSLPGFTNNVDNVLVVSFRQNTTYPCTTLKALMAAQ